jgi:hypothetical protein
MSAVMPPPVVPGVPGGSSDEERPILAADGDRVPGAGIRDLPDDERAALLKIRQNFEGGLDGNRARREYQKKCLKVLEMIRGNQYLSWDYTTGSWESISSASGGRTATGSSSATSQALYSMNIVQPYALTLEALLTGARMNVRSFPENPNNPDDVLAAEKATLVNRAHERFCRQFERDRRAIFALLTCGTFGSYIRTVTDGDRFGYMDEPVVAMQDVPIGEPHVTCPVCGDWLNSVPTPGVPAKCQSCGGPLPEEPEQPTAQLPQKVGTRKVPRARTVETIVDGFELKLPLDASEQAEFDTIVREREVSRTLVRGTWPDVEGDHSEDEPGEVGSNQSYGRRVRRQANVGTTVENRPTMSYDGHRVTLSEAWHRPRAFYDIDEEDLRKRLLARFPNGVKVTWADDQFCEARPEPMDKVWRICHALPGRSQIREPILGSLIPVQEVVNDLFNIIRDIIEYTIPATFINKRVLDVRSWARSQVIAGGAYPVVDTGRPVSDAFFQTEPGRLPEFATVLFEKLWTEVAQFLTGAFPAAFGGETAGNPTAEGREIQRQGALGRVNLFLQALQEHRAECAGLIVEDFVNNSTEPLSFLDENEGGEMSMSSASVEDFAIGKFRAQFEVVSEFPSTWAQRQALTLQMFQIPALQAWVGLLKNASKVRSVLGSELDVPRLASYKREFRLINKILIEAPQPGPPVPVTDPATGQPPVDPMTGQPVIDPATGQPPVQPGPPVCSQPTSPVDDAATMLEALRDFHDSQDGQRAIEKAKATGAGEGYQNYQLHIQERVAAAGAAAPPDQGAPQ